MHTHKKNINIQVPNTKTVFCDQELFTEFEDYFARVDVLFEKAAEIQLGSENQDLPLQQAHSTREALTQLQNNFKEKYAASEP